MMQRSIRTRYFASNILGIVFFLCLFQGYAYAWFHSSVNCESCPIFEQPRNADHVSKAYAFLPNKQDAAPEIRLYRSYPEEVFPTNAGELKIDIPFNLLSTSETNIQNQLDRRIAANLRLKNLLEQYLEQQRRNAEILKDLNIPYLDPAKNSKKIVSTSNREELPTAEGLKKKIAEIILFQGQSKEHATFQDNPDSPPVPAEKKGRGKSMSDTESNKMWNLKDDYSKSIGQTGGYHQLSNQDTELPWIFSLGLELLQSITNNKIEILSWAAVMAVIGLVGTIVVKR